MSYVGNSLGAHERLVILARFPWPLRAASWSALVLLTLIPIAIYLALLLGGSPRSGWLFLLVISAVTGLVIFGWIQLYMLTTELAVTDQRFVIKRGLIARHTNEIPLLSIENVELDQSVLARLLGYGRLRVAGSGDTKLITPPAQDPVTFRTALAEARAALTDRPSFKARAHRIDPLNNGSSGPVLDDRARERHVETKPRKTALRPGPHARPARPRGEPR